MKFRLSRAAQEDLISIYVHGVREFGMAQAEAYQDQIDHTIELIAENPQIARQRNELDPPVRVHPVNSHLIVYMIEDGAVRILRVRHAREDWISNPNA